MRDWILYRSKSGDPIFSTTEGTVEGEGEKGPD